ncbi:MAG: A24 family peptidase [Steroidobacteraceae bacterium]
MPVGWVVLFGMVVAVSDLRNRTIPNVLILLALCGTILVRQVGYGPEGLVSGLLGAVAALLLTLPMYWLKGMAAGDVKAMTVVGAMVGFALAPFVIGVTLVLGGGFAAAWAGWTRSKRVDREDVRRMKVPYGVAIALGTLAFGAWQVTQMGVEALWIGRL